MALFRLKRLAVAALALALPAPALCAGAPEFLRRPSYGEAAAAYPKLDVYGGRFPARATLLCGAGADGRLKDCAVEHEAPASLGFGQAALTLAPKFQLTPQAAAKAAASGEKFSIPVVFERQGARPYLWTPSRQEVLDAYPAEAWRSSRPGKAEIACAPLPTGQLGPCTVASETPAGEGFGAAAVTLANAFLLDPDQAQRLAAKGQKARVSVAFERLPLDPPPAFALRIPPGKTLAKDLDWASPPTASQMSRAFEGSTKAGRAMVGCDLLADGGVTGCVSIYETSPEMAAGSVRFVQDNFRAKPLPGAAGLKAGEYVVVPVMIQ